MVQMNGYKLAMPNSSFATIQKILKAYNAVRDREKPTVQDIADIAGMQRPVISSNNNFLRELGLLAEEENKLTELGARLAIGLELNNQSMVTEAIQESIRNSPGLSELVDMLRARGTMTRDTLQGHVIMRARLTKNSAGLAYVRTIIDYLIGGNFLAEEGENVLFVGHHPRKREQVPGSGAGAGSGTLPPPPSTDEVPIALGVGRLAYLRLPDQWTSRELPKLLRMIELALGDDIEQKEA